MYTPRLTLLLYGLIIFCSSCQSKVSDDNQPLRLGCERMEEYLPLLKDKKVGLLVNHTSLVGETHILDTLLSREVKVTKIFAPEHGFRGKADAGEHVKNNVDSKTGLPVISLYGKNKKPSNEQLTDVDVVIFDIQDVGVRFYTYISSMHYMMEACAENNIKMLVLDRPNPNGDYFDGPVLEKEFSSFVGMHPIPVVHGLTVAELASMINEEGWLNDSVKCDLLTIQMENYRHDLVYALPVKPSPNLPNDLSIRLYPSLCFFEATNVSVGRGTYMPFQIIGYPDSTFGEFSFTPQSIDGMSKHPPQQDKICYGIDLREEPLNHRFSMNYFLQFNRLFHDDELVTNVRWFNLLAGNSSLLSKIKDGWTEEAIKNSWSDELAAYNILRKRYLLYP
ncbi:exo-beta-N-acetylmuramidase NamZ family protein [Carboxylicivirga marina]|uniref:DUF1343 domain-containing protein n=1 Tax=Carboxylicivirga marina TaxID=2800988 RepID=A0ABS1HGN3_9BACT|nr:DUF1343 domain-containing protein [Carboxylicivirga marina]MBK3516791.1 DUF1343 domain-containing protein [Carboxylicivirga marina]